MATGTSGSPGRRTGSPQLMRNSRFDAGFTLIEILVVIVIVATIVSISMLSFGILGDDREIQTEAKRFIALTEVAQDDAIMQGREFGIEFMTAGYRFVEYDAFVAAWTDIPGDETLRRRGLPDDVEFELYLEGKHVLLDHDPAPFDDPEKRTERSATDVYSPHLMIFSSGDSTPFELHIRRAFDDVLVVLRGDALGAVEIVNPDEE